MTIILGIDPGSRITGYGVMAADRQGPRYIASGSIHTQSDNFPARLKQIFDGLTEIIALYNPQQMAIEQVFMCKNADSALKLGQARGAAICAGANRNLPVYEYAARQIKQVLVGKGNADKQQVQYMVKILLNIQGDMQIDASDALAVGLCHFRYRETAERMRTANL